MTDILIVEDNEELGALIRDFLKREGYSVTWKTSGEQGILALKEDKFRIMLLDVMLPGFDGFETLDKLRDYFKENYEGAKFETNIKK